MHYRLLRSRSPRGPRQVLSSFPRHRWQSCLGHCTCGGPRVARCEGKRLHSPVRMQNREPETRGDLERRVARRHANGKFGRRWSRPPYGTETPQSRSNAPEISAPTCTAIPPRSGNVIPALPVGAVTRGRVFPPNHGLPDGWVDRAFPRWTPHPGPAGAARLFFPTRQFGHRQVPKPSLERLLRVIVFSMYALRPSGLAKPRSSQ